MLRVAVCDDNKVTLDYLSNKIKSLLEKHSLEHLICSFSAGAPFIEAHQAQGFDVVFLDIAMPKMDGFQVAKEIRQHNNKTYIIFVTTESSLVYDSFDFQPFYFVPKDDLDIMHSKLNHVIDKLSMHLASNKKICLDMPFGEKKYVEPENIVFISSKSNYLDFHTTQKDEIHIRGKLDDYAEKLPDLFFVRIHNRYIVNMKHINRIENAGAKVLLTNDIILDISRTYKKDFMEAYNLYLRNYV